MKRVQFSQDIFCTLTWPPIHCFVHKYGRRDVMCWNDLYISSNLGSVLFVIFAKSISYVSFLSASPWCSLVLHVLSVGYAVTTQTRSMVSQLMYQVVSSSKSYRPGVSRQSVSQLIVAVYCQLVCSESFSLTVTKLFMTEDQSVNSWTRNI